MGSYTLCTAQVLPTLHHGLNEMGALRRSVQSSAVLTSVSGGEARDLVHILLRGWTGMATVEVGRGGSSPVL